MNFYTVKDQLLKFGNFNGGYRVCSVPACFIARNNKNKEHVVCAEEIRKLIISNQPNLATENNWNLDVNFYFSKVDRNSTGICQVIVYGDLVNALPFATPFNRVCMKTTITQFGIVDVYEPKQFTLESCYKPLSQGNNILIVDFPRDLENFWNSNSYKFQGYLTVEVLIEAGDMAQQTVNGNVNSFDLCGTNAKILKDMVSSDMVIVSKDRAETKCHKCFLAGHSDVFKAMLEGKYMEAQDGRLEMPDVSEKSVKAFLQFIYSGDLEPATNDFETALELFSIGHKYNIASLEQSITNILLANKNDTISIDEALRMFLLARNIDSANDLKLKAMEVFKLNSSLLRDSNVYKELLISEPEVLTDLLQLALQK